MLLQWKIRTNHSNAIDIFDKVSGMHKENGAEFTTLGVLTGADNGSFAISVNFINYESYGLMDDAWNNSTGKWDQLIEPNLGSNTQLIETMYMRKIVGNIDDTAPLSQIKILPYKEKNEWMLETKYNIGKKKEVE